MILKSLESVKVSGHMDITYVSHKIDIFCFAEAYYPDELHLQYQSVFIRAKR